MVHCIPSDTEDLVTISIGIHAGAVHDEQVGETTFTALMLSRGTERHTADAFADEVERRGCSISTSADRDAVTLMAVGLREYGGDLVSLLADCLLRPRFDADEVDRQRERKAADFMMNVVDPEWLAAHALVAVAFEGHPYARPREGTPATLASIGPDRMRAVHARLLTAPRDIIVAGAFDVDGMVAALDGHLGDMPVAVPPPVIAMATSTPRLACLAHRDDAVQTVLRVGLPAVGPGHPDAPGLALCVGVLGGYTLARLFSILREEKGYTYGAYAMTDARVYGRQLMAMTSVGNDFTADTCRILASEIDRMGNERIADDELSDTRQYMLGVFARSQETPQQTASMVWTMIQHGLADDHYDRWVKALQEVDADALRDVQRRYFSTDAWYIGASGAESVVRPALEGLVDDLRLFDVDTMTMRTRP